MRTRSVRVLGFIAFIAFIAVVTGLVGAQQQFPFPGQFGNDPIKGDINILLAPKGLDNNFFQTVDNGAQEQTSALSTASSVVNVEYNGSERTDAAEEISFLEQRLNAGGIDCAILTAEATAEQFKPLIQAYHEAGVPVIMYDSAAPGAGALAFVGISSFEGGRQAGEFFVSQFPASYQPLDGSDTIKYMINTGSLAAQNLEDRRKGFLSVVSQNSRFEQAGTLPAFVDGDTVAGAAMVFAEELASNPLADGLFITNTGLFQTDLKGTLETNNRIQGDGTSNLVFVGFDPSDASVSAIADGLADAVIGQNEANYGQQSVELCVSLLRGEVDLPFDFGGITLGDDPATPWIQTPTLLVTQENAKVLFPQFF